MDVVVNVAGGEQQAALEVPGQLRIGGDAVLEAGGVVAGHLLDAVVLLRPVGVVDVVLVVARRGHRHLEEIRIDQHRGGGHETTARVAVDPHPLDVDERVPVGELLDGGLLVGQAVVAQVAVAEIVVPLGAVGVAATVADGDDNHPELRQAHFRGRGGEGLGHRFGLGTRVHVRHDRVLLRRVEVERLVHHAVEVGDPVRRLDRERLGELIAGLHQSGEVSLLEVQDLPPRGDVNHRRARRHVHPRIVVHGEAVGFAQRRPVVEVPRVHQRESLAVQAHPVGVLVIRILPGLARVATQVDHAAALVDPLDAANVPRSLRQPVLQRAIVAESVNVGPPIALGPPEQVAIAEQFEPLVLDIGVQPLLDDHPHRSGGGVGHDHVHLVLVAAAAPEPDFLRGS